MAETRPKKRGRPPGSRQQPKPTPIPEFIIPTAFSRSGRPLKMKELADGTHFGIMNLPLATKQEMVSESPSPPPAKKRRLEKKAKVTSPATTQQDICPEKEAEEKPAEDSFPSTEESEKSSADIFLYQTTTEGKSRRKKAIPKRPVSDGHGSVFLRTKTKDFESLQIKITRDDKKVTTKVLKEEATKLKSKIENGEPLPPNVQKCLDKVILQKRKMVEAEREEIFAHKDMIAKELEYIYQMAECDLLIKDSLSRSEWDHQKCLGAFRRLWAIPVTRQMLFKFPKAFETARHVHSRIEQMEAYTDPRTPPDQDAIVRHHICEAAKKVYECYKSVFTYSEDNNFWDYFRAELEHYQADASRMSTYEYYNSDRLPYLARCFSM